MQRVDIIDKIINDEKDMLRSDVSYQHLCDKIAYHITNFQPKTPLIERTSQRMMRPNNKSISYVQNEPQINENLQHQSTIDEQKRCLPIKPKEKIFDEWGAVFKQQDEFAQKIKEREQTNFKLQQANYREELEKQIRHRKQINEQYTQSLHMSEKDEAEKVKRAIEENQKLNYQLAEGKKDKAKELIKEMEVHQKQKESTKIETKNRDKQEFIHMLQDEQSKQKEYEHNKKQANIKSKEEILRQNEMLLKIKQQQKQIEAEREKMYERLQSENNVKTDQERQHFFDYLHNIQQRQSTKEQLFKDRIVQNNEQLSKIDEQRYMQSLSQEEKKSIDKEIIEKSKKANQKEVVIKTLQNQMNEQKQKTNQTKEEEMQYAQYIKHTSTLENENASKKNKEAVQKNEVYKQVLLKQIEEQGKLKLYHGVMSDYEIKVNQKDIDAYKSQVDEINCKLPGLNIKPIVQVQGNHSVDMPPAIQKKNDFYETENQKYMNSNIIKTIFEHKNNSVGSSPSKLREYTKVAENAKLLLKAQENMQDPLIYQKRNTTLNGEYGCYARKIRNSEGGNSMLAKYGHNLVQDTQDISADQRKASFVTKS